MKSTEEWIEWLAEMKGSYKSEEPLKPQELFHDIMVKAQSLIIESVAEQAPGVEEALVADPHSFRNLLREKIGLEVPHDEAESLKSLKPDIVVVRKEHKVNPPNFGQFSLRYGAQTGRESNVRLRCKN